MCGEHKACSGNSNRASEVDSVCVCGGHDIAELVHDDHVACSALVHRSACGYRLACCVQLDCQASGAHHLLLGVRIDLHGSVLGIFLGDDRLDRKIIVRRVCHVGVSVLVSH